MDKEFQSTSGFFQKFTSPASPVQLNAWRSEWLTLKEWQAMRSVNVHKNIRSILFLLINKFHVNGPPTVCPERSSTRTRLLILTTIETILTGIKI